MFDGGPARHLHAGTGYVLWIASMLLGLVAAALLTPATSKTTRRLAGVPAGESDFRQGIKYSTGQGVRQDHAQALLCYERAANQGHAGAQYKLALMYANGQGKLDLEQAAKWYRKAAEQGIANAQYNLGCMYHSGQGVPKDKVIAAALIALAASRGDALAVKNRPRIRAELTPEQLEEARELLAQWRPGGALPFASKTWRG